MIQECIEFWDIVKNLMDMKEIDFSESNNPSINVITGTTYSETPSSTGPRPITIFYDNEAAIAEVPEVSTPVLMVEVPRHFSYKSQKVVPCDKGQICIEFNSIYLVFCVVYHLFWTL